MPSTLQLALERREAEDGFQRGRLAGAVRADETDDAAGLDGETHAVERAGGADRTSRVPALQLLVVIVLS